MSLYNAVRRLFVETTPHPGPDTTGSARHLPEHRLRADAESILQSAVAAVDPEPLVARTMEAHARSIPANGRVWVAGFGKAVIPMARGLHTALGDRVEGAVLIAPPGGQAYVAPQYEIFTGGHPVPDPGGEAGARAIRQLALEAQADDLLICLVSGGGSALLTLPPDDLPLSDVQVLTELLLRSGASIDEINCVRKHVDMLKGGQLVRAAAPARVLSLVLSDVFQDPAATVASGPTAADSTRFGDAVAVLKRYGLWQQLPLAARGWLDRGRCGEIEDTPDKNDPIFLRSQNVVIGDSDAAARAACEAAAALGYDAQVLTTSLTGDAAEAGGFLAETARIVRASQSPEPRPMCLVTTGATSARARSGVLGNRNQQLALAAALKLDRMEGVLVASMGTDGFDGAAEVAGATATGSTVRRATEAGLDCETALAEADAYTVFRQLEDQISSGPTGTDVADIQIVLMA